MYIVTENKKPCTSQFFNVHETWFCALYSKREDAVEYAQQWLGMYAPDKEYWDVNDSYSFGQSIEEDSVLKITLLSKDGWPSG